MSITPLCLRILQGRRYEHPSTSHDTIDCSRLVWEVVRRLYPRVELVQPEVVVADPNRPWSCIEHLDGRVGREVETPEPGCWHVCQGWDARKTSGHQWFWYEPPLVSASRDGEVWEATDALRSWHRLESPYWMRRWDEVRMVVLHG